MPTIIGVEVAKASILCCKLSSDSIPSDLSGFARSYTPIPLLSNISGLSQLLELGDCYVLEPTGDYSRIWTDSLKANGKTVLRVNPKRVRALKEYAGISSKSDRYDAAFLALYGAMNQGDPSAFLSEYAEDLRNLTLQHQTLSRAINAQQNRLWQQLSYEWPEACRTKSGTKPQQNREWLQASPPALWRFVAGEAVRGKAQRQAALNETIGSGLSDLSVALASQICELERQQHPLEERIDALASSPEFAPYQAVFDRFGFGPMTRAVILSRIHPFSQFLGEDGKPIKIKLPSLKAEGRYHRRDKSLGAFRLALGNGTRLYQSGQISEQRAAGSKLGRTALYLHVKTKIVIIGGRLAQPPRLRQHYDLYCQLGEMPHNQAVMKVASRIVKDLYRDLLTTL
jgi:transposase